MGTGVPQRRTPDTGSTCLGAAGYGLADDGTTAGSDLLGAAGYGRISRMARPDEVGGEGDDEAGVNRQIRDADKLIVAHPRWRHRGFFVDNDLSATDGKFRPRFAALLDVVRRGEVKVIVCYMMSRLVRNPKESAEVFELLAKHGVNVVCTNDVSIDFSTPAGHMVAQIMAAVNYHEVKVLGARVARQIKDAAEAGYSTGARIYGYLPDPNDFKNARTRVIVEEEAKVIRQIRDWILVEGKPLSAIADALNAAGIRPRFSDKWKTSSLRTLMTNPAIAGYKSYGGKVYKARWPGIITYEDHLRITELLRANARSHGTSNKIRHLLSYVALCGKCLSGECDCQQNNGQGHRVGVVGHGKSDVTTRGRRYHLPPHYRCQDKGQGGCNGLRLDMRLVDDYVTKTVLAMLADPDVVGAVLVSGAPDVEAAMAVQAEIDACRAKATAIGLDMARTGATELALVAYKAALAELGATLDGLRRQQAAMSRATVISGVTDLGDLVRHWHDLTVQQRRDIIADAVQVVILPATHRGEMPSISRIRIEWKAALSPTQSARWEQICATYADCRVA